jgi:hypothetical protein
MIALLERAVTLARTLSGPSAEEGSNAGRLLYGEKYRRVMVPDPFP